MHTGLTPSEEFVARLCEQAFLKLWTHPNPLGKKGKELCDCLVVCGSHVVIISVKEIEYANTCNQVGWRRWHKAAVDKSAQQIWGAERWLQEATVVLRKDGREISLPPAETRNYHRISVSLGARGEVPTKWGELGNGFVHLFDEYSLVEAFCELDTITDFVEYLTAVESLISQGVRPVFVGGGTEDLLALYVRNGEDFGILGREGGTPDTVIITEGISSDLVQSSEYAARNQDLSSSYAWDRLIDHFAEDLLTNGMFDMHSKEVTKDELALVAMALQPRSHRANLADAFMEFLGEKGSSITSRVVVVGNKTAFVFLGGDSSDREYRSRELALRCLVVRGRSPNVDTIVGIATDKPKPGKSGHSSDILYKHLPIWTEADAENVDCIQRELGYFKNTMWSSAMAPNPSIERTCHSRPDQNSHVKR
ncbi:MAG: hypothetical protein V4568_16400 [Pseudomonadota bacterium]